MQIERLGPYKIIDQLGKGGMGTVYKAVNTETGEPAAVKLLSAALAQEEGFRDRFQGEIETLRKLNHPNIVRLFGFGEQDGLLFYGMELVAGDSLEAELNKGRRFDWREVVRIAIEVCRALRHAHDRGIIHRDLKPANLLMAADGRIKLSDFGIARFFGNTRLTGVGAIIGTAEYMAPEQAAGRAVEPRSDLYSLGAVLYSLLARRSVFKGKSLGEVLQKQQFEKPESLRRYNDEVPEELERIILQLLEKDPDRRIPTATILCRVFEAMQHAMAIPGETVQADAQYYTAEPIETEAGLPDPAPPAASDKTSGFQAKPLATQAAAGPLPDPYAQTVATPTAISAVAEAAVPETKSSAHFVPVAEEDLDQKETGEASSPIFAWQTGILVAALLAVGWGIWYYLQPPSADRLYQRIQSASQEGSIGALLLAESDVNEFLNRYGNDPRAQEIRRYGREIDIHKLELKFKRASGGGQLLPVQRACFEALSYEESNPELCMEKLQQLIDLYGYSKKEESGPTGDCVTWARRKLKQMNEALVGHTADDLKLIDTRLDEADGLAKSNLQHAREIYQAVIGLYAGKPWAAEAVRRAEAGLEKLKAKTEKSNDEGRSPNDKRMPNAK
jgi:eukaryotic-like serine/threonine-protein kinase